MNCCHVNDCTVGATTVDNSGQWCEQHRDPKFALCEDCGATWEGEHYSAADASRTGSGVMLCHRCCAYRDAGLRWAHAADRELVDQCNKLATRIARAQGWDVPDGLELHASVRGDARSAWALAVLACDELRDDDVVNALAAISDEDE